MKMLMGWLAELWCQVAHNGWEEQMHMRSNGANYRCHKPGCRAQRLHDGAA